MLLAAGRRPSRPFRGPVVRLLELYLPAFGPFTDVGLDFSRGGRGLHIVYGPNEAGKSSSLRGLRALFYGIPLRSTDDFRHDAKKLRVGARLRDEEGQEFAFLRRKGRKDTILDLDDTPIEDLRADRLLGLRPEDLFVSLFGIDHDSLSRGAQELLERGGELGESLFAAALGGSGLWRTLGALELEMEGLFKPQGQKPLVNRAVSEFHHAKKIVAAKSLSAREWQKYHQDLATAQQEAEAVDRDIARLRKEERWALQLRRGIQDLTTALENEMKLRSELSRTQDRMATLEVPAGILEQGEVIDSLYRRLGGHLKAGEDRIELERARQERLFRAERLARGLRPDLPLEEIEELRLAPQQQTVIRDLSSRYELLGKAVESLREDLSQQTAQIGVSREILERVQPPPSPRELQACIQMAQKHGDLEEQMGAAVAGLDIDQQQIDRDLEKLSLWDGTLDALERLAVCSDETIDRFEGEYKEIEKAIAASERDLRAAEERTAAVDTRLREIQLTGSLPTERELEDARDRRRAGWRTVRALVVEKQAEDVGRVDAASLAESYEQSVADADEIADRLRREAARVGERATLEAQREAARAEVEKSTRALAAAAENLRGCDAAWEEKWRGLEGKPLSPSEMRSWLSRQRRLVEKAATVRESRRRIEGIGRRIEECHRELSRQLEMVGCGLQCGHSAIDDSEGSGLRSLVNRGLACVEELGLILEERKARELEFERLERAAATVQTKLAERLTELEEVEGKWGAALGSVGETSDTTPAQANAILERLDEIFSSLDQAVDLKERTSDIEKDAERFRPDVRQLVEQVAAEFVDVPVVQAVGALHGRLNLERENHAVRKQLSEDRAEKADQLRAAQDVIEEARRELEGLCRHPAGTAEPGFDAVAGRRWPCIVAASVQPLAAEDREGGNGAIAECVTALRLVDAGGLGGQLDELGRDLAALDAVRSELDQRIGRQKGELERLDGSAEAAEVAAEAQGLLARIRHGAERYARLRVASSVLKRQIEICREKNQGPLLERAGELFRKLTRESFVTLKAGLGDREWPVLEGVRQSAEEVRVDGMSSGTRDQLYLSLRIASLERHLKAHPPLPLVIDDLLIHFDDARAEATLEVLAELSRQTQIIFFTHHRHLVEIARRTVSPKVLQVPNFLAIGGLSEKIARESY